jgi:hypothetical protein
VFRANLINLLKLQPRGLAPDTVVVKPAGDEPVHISGAVAQAVPGLVTDVG